MNGEQNPANEYQLQLLHGSIVASNEASSL